MVMALFSSVGPSTVSISASEGSSVVCGPFSVLNAALMVAVPVPFMRLEVSSNVQFPVLSGSSSPTLIWRTFTSCRGKYSALTSMMASLRPASSRGVARNLYSFSPMANAVSTGSIHSGKSKVKGTLELTEMVKSVFSRRRTPEVCTAKYSSTSL